MNYKIIYYFIQFVLLWTSYEILSTVKYTSKHGKYSSSNGLFDWMKDSFFGTEETYAWIRVFAMFALTAGTIIFMGDKTVVYIIIVLVFLVSTPKKRVLGVRTPYSIIITTLKSSKMDKLDDDLLGIMVSLKNLAISSNVKVSKHLLFELILDFSSETNKYLSTYFILLVDSDKEKADKYLLNAIDTELARDFRSLIAQIDHLSIENLQNELELIIEKKISENDAKEDMKMMNSSAFLFAPALLQLVLTGINFMMILQQYGMYLRNISI